MCRSHVEGYRRCKGSAATKAQESLRKAINYQANKAGLSPQGWKDQNPELLELINKSYDERLNKFESKLDSNESDNTSKDAVGFVDSTGETLLIGVQTPEAAAKEHPIRKYDFATKGEKRMGNSTNGMIDYLGESESYIENDLKLNKLEKHALLCYSNDMYLPLNKYFLKKDHLEIFNEHEPSWQDSDDGDQLSFKNEEDLTDCANRLDSALSHRLGEERIVYRGMRVRPHSGIILGNNDGKKSPDTESTRAIMQKVYAPGSTLAFDSYSSASDSIDIATDWCSADATWSDPPTSLLFEIKSSAGVPIAYVSGHDSEREVLLPRGMNFKVVNSYWNGKTEEDCYKFDGTNSNAHRMAKNTNTLIVQLVEVDDDGSEITDHSARYVAPKLSPAQVGTENNNV